VISQEISIEEKINIDTMENENLDASQKKQESAEQPKKEIKKNSSLDRVIELTNLMEKDTDKALDMINTINRKTEFLAINALIEASRSGDAGKGFQVVAESIDILAQKTKEAVETMRKETLSKMGDLGKVIQNQSENIRGNRLSDLALTNIDLIDRNLYERTADVRWWATDRSVVNALTQKTTDTSSSASKRLGIILKYYTIYHDLILSDLEGNVVSNGSSQYALTGRNVSDRPWFKSALSTGSGEDYGFETVHKSQVINNNTILTFSCKVHQNGDTSQPVIGILASVFNWTCLAQTIINQTSINQVDKSRTRICIVDKDGKVFADSLNLILEDTIEFEGREQMFTEKNNFGIYKFNGNDCLIGHAQSPGFEGYSTGWHSLILQEIKNE
jgi:hypothetical protein